MRRVLVAVFISLLLLPMVYGDELPKKPVIRWSEVKCSNGAGNSTIDRVGCMDTDGDGFSDPDANWTWVNNADSCPFTYGTSREILCGCPDMDNDWYADMIDPDIDGDGITNEFELIASSLHIRYDPYDRNSVPPDSDYDLIPDVIDEDDDNDGWPDLVEIDRGSDEFDVESTPFTLYFGISTGFFYEGGFSTTTEYTSDGAEISISGLIEIVTEELIIPILLIPLYLALFGKRRKHFKRFSLEIEEVETYEELAVVEQEVNQFVKDKKIKVYHGLVLRNSIEQKETEFGGESLVGERKNQSSHIVEEE